MEPKPRSGEDSDAARDGAAVIRMAALRGGRGGEEYVNAAAARPGDSTSTGHGALRTYSGVAVGTHDAI
ncbi:MAG: hypothetical protein ABSF08_10795 [Candidatus Cybelea sp.]